MSRVRLLTSISRFSKFAPENAFSKNLTTQAGSIQKYRAAVINPCIPMRHQATRQEAIGIARDYGTCRSRDLAANGRMLQEINNLKVELKSVQTKLDQLSFEIQIKEIRRKFVSDRRRQWLFFSGYIVCLTAVYLYQ